MSDDDEELVPKLPVSPSTGLDPEIRQFVGRIMQGYESAHRTIAEMAAENSKSTAELHKAVNAAITMQMKAAEEREELISKRHKRELEAQESAQRQAGFAQLSSDVRAIGTLALKRYLGIPITGNDSHGLQDFLSTMSGDQVETLMSTGTLQLTDAQRHSLMGVFTSLANAEAKKLPEAAE